MTMRAVMRTLAAIEANPAINAPVDQRVAFLNSPLVLHVLGLKVAKTFERPD